MKKRAGWKRPDMSARTGANAISYKHGAVRTSEYSIWSSMLARCHNKNVSHYKSYGGRGISVCERWKDFRNFLADMGHKPSPHHTLDRIDNNGNYEPGNCRWATPAEQINNRRNTRFLTINGRAVPLYVAAREAGSTVHPETIWKRIATGWDVENALKTPFIGRW